MVDTTTVAGSPVTAWYESGELAPSNVPSPLYEARIGLDPAVSRALLHEAWPRPCSTG